MKLYENGRLLREVKDVEEAKKVIVGCDLAMATADSPLSTFQVKRGKRTVYRREGRI